MKRGAPNCRRQQKNPLSVNNLGAPQWRRQATQWDSPARVNQRRRRFGARAQRASRRWLTRTGPPRSPLPLPSFPELLTGGKFLTRPRQRNCFAHAARYNARAVRNHIKRFIQKSLTRRRCPTADRYEAADCRLTREAVPCHTSHAFRFVLRLGFLTRAVLLGASGFPHYRLTSGNRA